MSTPRGSLIGVVLGGRHRIVQLLASGGVGDVYLADPHGVHGTHGADAGRERVAVKVLRAEHHGAPAMVARFRREAAVLGRVRHPNVLSVVGELIDEGGVLAFATELLVGLDLADTLAYAQTLDAPRAVGIAVAAAEGLEAAHAAGVAHGDIRAENIFLVHAPDGGETVKLIDFGAVGAVAKQGQAADVRALGGVLFEMLTGIAPSLRDPHRDPGAAGSREGKGGLAVSDALAVAIARASRPAGDQGEGAWPSMAAFRSALLATPEAAALARRSTHRRG